MLIRFLKSASQRTLLVEGIGVGEQKPLPVSFVDDRSDGVGLTGPTGRHRTSGSESSNSNQGAIGSEVGAFLDASKGRNDFRGSVGRAVVDQEQFKWDALLPDEGAEAPVQGGLLVAGGHDNRDLGCDAGYRWFVILCHRSPDELRTIIEA